MKIFNYVLRVVINTFFVSATPNLFGSKKRREEKAELSAGFKQSAVDTQKDIDQLKVQNPFESAAAKSAMTAANRKAKQTQQRFANVMGGNSNPEAAIAAQSATQNAVAGAAGDIAVGSEAQKQAGLAQLRGEKARDLGQAGQLEQAAINERGAGWKDFFSAWSFGNTAGLMKGVGAGFGSSSK